MTEQSDQGLQTQQVDFMGNFARGKDTRSNPSLDHLLQRLKQFTSETKPGDLLDRLKTFNFWAKDKIARWTEKLKNGELFIVFGCSDSRILRVFPGDHSVMDPSISAAGQENYKGRIKHKGKIIAVHYPCGGAAAKAELEKTKAEGRPIPQTGLAQYIDTRLKATITQTALHEASQASAHSNEPVLAVVVDNVTGEIIPIAYIEKNADGEIIVYKKAKNIEEFDPAREDQTNPFKRMPRLGMKRKHVGVFAKYLRECKTHREKFLQKFPDLKEKQNSQNPSMLFLDSPENPPLSIRFAGDVEEAGGVSLLSAPGGAFRITCEEDESGIDYFDAVLQQAEYPLDHFDIDTVVIQTQNLAKSRERAKRFLATEKGKAWLFKNPNNKLLLLDSMDGMIENNDYITSANYQGYFDRHPNPTSWR